MAYGLEVYNSAGDLVFKPSASYGSVLAYGQISNLTAGSRSPSSGYYTAKGIHNVGVAGVYIYGVTPTITTSSPYPDNITIETTTNGFRFYHNQSISTSNMSFYYVAFIKG
ncbi:MAG: hypothetical protein VW496_05050 [Pelagibacteraceae bacterium]